MEKGCIVLGEEKRDNYMKQIQGVLQIDTLGQGLIEITKEVEKWAQIQDICTGVITIFIRHTSASLVIQENADPLVVSDLEKYFKKMVPEDTTLYSHIAEGSDDMPAHIKCALTETSLSIPINNNKMLLGTWQGIFVFEHRVKPHVREIILHISGVSKEIN